MKKGSNSVVSAAFILGAASLASRVAGLLRERALTTTFGAGDTFDAFVAAFRLPDLVFNLVVIGALSAAFIPLFTDKLVKQNRGREEAFSFTLALLNMLLCIMAVICFLYAALAPWLIPLITPGFSGEKLELTIRLSRIMALQPLILSVSFIFSGVLNSFKRFAAAALAPIFYNAGIIIGVLFLVPAVGSVGLAWGVVLGAFLHVAVQLPGIISTGFRWRPFFSAKAAQLKPVWRMMLPRVFGLAAQQINLLIETIIGSTLLSGSISVFYLASNLQYLPVGIFGLSFAQAAFPTLAEHMARGEKAEFRKVLMRSFRYILFFVIPASVLFFLLRAQMVRVLYGDGAFDWEDTILTLETFGFLIMSIFAQALIPLLTRAFYVQHDTKTPVVISSFTIALNAILSVILSRYMGVQGLAISFSVSSILNMALLLARLHWQLGGLDDRAVLFSIGRMTGAALFAGLIIQGLKYPLAAVVDMTRFWGVSVQLLGCALGGAAAYFAVCWLLKSEELTALRLLIPRSWKKSFVPLDEQPFGRLPE